MEILQKEKMVGLINSVATATGNQEFYAVIEELRRLWNIERLAKLVCSGTPTEGVSYYMGKNISMKDRVAIHQQNTKELIEAVKA